MTFGSMCNTYKTEIKEALNGMLVKGWEDGEPVTINGSKDECQKVILEIFDRVVHEGLAAMASARTLDRLYKNKVGKMPGIREYINIYSEEECKFNDYVYEFETEWPDIDDYLDYEEEADDGRDTSQK